MNDDEEHLVVLKSSRRRIVRRGDLQREKFRNFEVTAVGDLHAASVAKAAKLISERTLADSPSATTGRVHFRHLNPSIAQVPHDLLRTNRCRLTLDRDRHRATFLSGQRGDTRGH